MEGLVDSSSLETLTPRSQATSTPGTLRRERTAQGWVSVLVTSVFVAIPLTAVSFFDFWGRSLGGVIWTIMAALAGFAVANIRGLSMSATRFAPMLAFLSLGALSVAWNGVDLDGLHAFGQFSAFGLAYLAIASTSPSNALVTKVRKLAWLGLGVGTLVAVIFVFTPLVTGLVEPRSLSISMAALFTVATIGEPRQSRVVIAGVLAFGVAGITTSRTASVVILLLIVFRLWHSARSQVKIATLVLAGVVLIAVINSSAFQERIYLYEVSASASLSERVSAINTAGRTAIWPDIFQRCLATPFLGSGMGSVTTTMADLAGPRLAHPHNDYLRLFCDGGLAGLTLFWLFIARVVFNPGRHWGPTRRESGAGPLSPQDTFNAATMILVCLMLFSITDNILVYIPYFMLPAAVVLGWHTAAINERKRDSLLPGPTTR